MFETMSTTLSPVRAHDTIILTHYHGQQEQAAQGWQQSIPDDERARLALEFFTSYRLLKPEVREAVAIRHAIRFETHTFNVSQSKDRYMSTLKGQLKMMHNSLQDRTQKNLANFMSSDLRSPMQPQGIRHGQPIVSGPIRHMGTAPMSLHPGVTGSFVPVSQAGPMMAGMQPGIGPSAHALSHLQPEQAGPMMEDMRLGVRPSAHTLSHLQPQEAAHLFAQQQQQQQQQQQILQMNPALVQQQQTIQRQVFLPRQQQMLQQQQHRPQQNGMGMGFPTSVVGENMNPQQIAAMQSGVMEGPQGFVNIPRHLRAQIQQHHLAQQAQQAQQQQQAQQNGISLGTPTSMGGNLNSQLTALRNALQISHRPPRLRSQMLDSSAISQEEVAPAQALAQQQQLQQQHMVTMQHSLSQESNHSPAGSQGPPTTTQPQQASIRPPLAVESHQSQDSPASQPTPQQQPQQQRQQHQQHQIQKLNTLIPTPLPFKRPASPGNFAAMKRAKPMFVDRTISQDLTDETARRKELLVALECRTLITLTKRYTTNVSA